MKRNWHIPSGKISPRHTNETIDYESLRSEWAVAAVLGGSPDYRHYPGPDEGHDLIINGVTVQVKFNHYPDGDLYIMGDEEMTADIAILVTPRDNLLALVGWTTKEEFESKHRIVDYGYGSRKALPQSELKGMRDLLCMSERKC